MRKEDVLKLPKIGAVYDMNYRDCTIVSNDKWKEDAGGIAENALLIAHPAYDYADYDQLLLLRVREPAQLPNVQDLKGTRRKAMQDIVEEDKSEITSSDATTDKFTQREVQYSGIRAEILGTFYPDGDEYAFGSDVDTFFSSGNYIVRKCVGEVLEEVVSYPRQDDSFKIGSVQYTATERPDCVKAPVHVNVDDFVAEKTAVFGMTGQGKSNTMKIIASVIATSGNTDVGQLVFDPSGEYAHENQNDDGTALSQLESALTAGFGKLKDYDLELEIDFFEPNNVEFVMDRLRSELRDKDSDYITGFRDTTINNPKNIEDEKEKQKHEKRISALYAILKEAGLESGNQDVSFRVNKHIREDFNENERDDDEVFFYIPEEHYDKTPTGVEVVDTSSGRVRFGDFEMLYEFWSRVANQYASSEEPYESWVNDKELENILQMLREDRSGIQKIEKIDKFHKTGSEGNPAEEVYPLLEDGNVVIVDVSSGDKETINAVTKRIVQDVLSKSEKSFRNNEKPPNIQVYLEEAHRRFDTPSYDEEMDPYVKLAKEGRKFNIGMTYATQEVTGVDGRVLANTSNWFVSHLNSQEQTSELSKYYTFGNFSGQIRRISKTGIARVKTDSAKYIIPTNIRLFDEDLLQKLEQNGDI